MDTNNNRGPPSQPTPSRRKDIDIESLEPISGPVEPTSSLLFDSTAVSKLSAEKGRHRRQYPPSTGNSSIIKNKSQQLRSPLWRLQRRALPSFGTTISGLPLTTTSTFSVAPAHSSERQPLLPLHSPDQPMSATATTTSVPQGVATGNNGFRRSSSPPATARSTVNGNNGTSRRQEGSASTSTSSAAIASVSTFPASPTSAAAAAVVANSSISPVVISSNEGIEVTHGGTANTGTKITENVLVESAGSDPVLSPLTPTRPRPTTTTEEPLPGVASLSSLQYLSSSSSAEAVDALAVEVEESATTNAVGNTPARKEPRRSSLLASSRKVVKATVVRPARAVTRVFRGGNTKASGHMALSTYPDPNTSPATGFVQSSGALPENSLLTVPNLRGGAGPITGGIYGSLKNGSFDSRGGAADRGKVTVAGPSDGDFIPALMESGTIAPSVQYDPAAVAGVTSRNADWAVHSMESFTRQLALVCIAFIVGTGRPEWLPQVSRTAEFAVTAWVTCLAIIGLSFLQKRVPHHLAMTERDRYDSLMSTRANDAGGGGGVGVTNETDPLLPARTALHGTPSLRQSPQQISHDRPTEAAEFTETTGREVIPTENTGPKSVDQIMVDRTPSMDESSVGGTSLRDAPSSSSSSFPTIPMEHPSLSQFFVIDTDAGNRVFCNSSKPHRISNEWFEMDMVCLIRTPDVDDRSAPRGTPSNEAVASYMRTKQRRFEFQYQVKLKKTPVGKQVYFSCELKDSVKMGIVTKAFVGAAMAFVKQTNPTFHYSITGSKKTDDGKYEAPHMSFTVEAGLDRLVVTKPGETPPELGTLIHEDPESIKRRKKGFLTDWNVEDTYTMALWSSYVDFLDWKVLNLPGIRPFGLSSVLGTQSIELTMYLINENRESDKHYRKDITEIIRLELSNNEVSAVGTAAMQWLAKNQQKRHSDFPVAPPPSSVGGSGMRSRATSDESETMVLDDEGDGVNVSKMALSLDDLMEDIEEVEEDVATAAELGEGIYLRSGDTVILRELVPEEESSNPCSVANGGGFAVLQDQDFPIVIEKAKRSKKSKLIKSGDTVIFKMTLPKTGTDEVELRYLTIHRGWWLKWVTSMPTKNGYFTVFTHETEFRELKGGKIVASDETQSSFLTLGGSFTLRHKRWAKYHVGIAAEPSATYGGRMMALYNPNIRGKSLEEDKQRPQSHLQYYNSDEEVEMERDLPSIGKVGWMKPLVLMAHEPSSLMGVPSLPTALSAEFDEDIADLSFIPSDTKLIFSNEHSQADVPAWIEMMNRVERVRQLVYVVRVVHRSPLRTEEKSQDDYDGTDFEVELTEQPETFVRLRTGKELAHLMSIGQSVRMTPTRRRTLAPSARGTNGDVLVGQDRTKPRARSNSSDTVSRAATDEAEGGAVTDAAIQSMEATLIGRRHTSDHAIAAEDMDEAYNAAVARGEETAEMSQYDDVEDEAVEEVDDFDDGINEDSSVSDSYSSESEQGRRGALRKGKALLGKSAKLAKKTAKTAVGTTKFAAKGIVETGKVTGKLASSVAKKSVKQSRKVVKGTVKTGVNLTKNTGKALIAPVTRKSNKPPKSEPKKKSKEKEDAQMIGVSKKMRKLEKIEDRIARPPTFVAGELCAPEQSCRTASRVLSRMSNVPFMSQEWQKCSTVLSAEVGYQTEQDRWFLEGSAVHLGVTPFRGDTSRGALLEESLVARCLWESHWREEWCGMYESCVSFFSPLTSSACLEIAYIDVTSVRPLDAGAQSPLPGFPILVLETAWLCHYVAFHDEETRDTFGQKVEQAIENHIKRVEATASIEQSELRKARFWQGFQTLSETSLSSGAGKWAKIVSNQKRKARIVLNGRRMAFDRHSTTIGDMSGGFTFVEDLLTRALSFSSESLEKDPESFVEFLDLTSQLRFLPLDEISLASSNAFCLFVNIYHCLLQQAMLHSVNGPLVKKSAGHFMRTSCYEIGGDVFSLAELQSCVIRGKMSKPINPKAPYIEAPKKSNVYRYYALDYKDPRVHFVLNTGDTACPVAVPVLKPALIERQLRTSSAVFFANKQLVIDTKRRMVTLPRVCDVFRNDFASGDALTILKCCLGWMDEESANSVRLMMMDESNLIIRFHHASENYHSSLKLRRDNSEDIRLSFTSKRQLSSASIEIDL